MLDLRTAAIAALMLAMPLAAQAKTVTVHMKNKASSGAGFMVFEPAYVAINPGDTVVFKATDKGHDAVSIPGMVPAGAPGFKGKIGQDVSVTFKTAGLYGVKCTPHLGMGMVGLVKVGKPTNAAQATAAANALPGMAKKRMVTLLGQAR